MITTFDVARWGVRATLISLSFGHIFQWLSAGASLFFLRQSVGSLTNHPFFNGASAFRFLAPVVILVIFYFFSEVWAREMGGSHEHFTLENSRQLRPMGIAFVGFVFLAQALPPLLIYGAILTLTAVTSRSGFSLQNPTLLTLAVPVAVLLIQFLIGASLFFWRRIARLFARNSTA